MGRSGLHRGIDAFFGNVFALDNRNEDRRGACRNRNSLRRADQFAVEFRNDESDRFRRARRVRHDIDGSRSGPSEIAFSVRSIEYHLIARISMYGRHDTALNRRVIVQRFRHGSKAVRRAGSGGNNLVLFRQRLLIYAVNDRRQIVARRSRNNDLLRARVDMRLRFCFRCIEACAFEDDIYADLSPRKIRGVLLRIDRNFLSVHRDGIVIAFHRMAFISSLCRIIL